MTTYWAEHAWLPNGPATSVRITVQDGRFGPIQTHAHAHHDDVRIPGVVLPGLANTHSHAFHRALRGRTHGGSGNFWTWREQMYAVTQRLNPDTYFALGPSDVRRDGAGRHHRRRRVPLPAPQPVRTALRRPQRHGRRPDRGGRRGRHPDHAARHLLPRRRPDRRGAYRARRRPAAVQRRLRRRVARPDVAAHPAARRHRPGRCRRPLGPGRAQALARGGRRLGRGPADPRAPLRAARREHRLRDVLRLLADRASRRHRRAATRRDRRPRDPRQPRGRQAARGGGRAGLASAPPPNATWPTGSAPRGTSPTPGSA